LGAYPEGSLTISTICWASSSATANPSNIASRQMIPCARVLKKSAKPENVLPP
jgi:hypothetical protein